MNHNINVLSNNDLMVVAVGDSKNSTTVIQTRDYLVLSAANIQILKEE